MIERAQRNWTPTTLSCVGAILLLTLVGGGLLGGCASSDPQISGMGFFNSRNVTVGEQVQITLPLSDSGASQWRIAQFDSLMLRPFGRGGFSEQNGKPVQVVTFVARTPGETEVIFERQGERGQERRTFKVKIHEPLIQ